MKSESRLSPFITQAEDYDGWYDLPKGNAIFTSELKAFQKVMSSLHEPWLEMGVGSGRFAQALGIKVGLDPSGELLKIARGRGIITVLGEAEKHVFPAESYGTVFLITTLCFLDDPHIALQEIHRVLKPGGKIVVGFVPASSPWGIYYLQKKQAGHPFYKFANFYSYGELNSVLEKTGFATESIVSTLFNKPSAMCAVETPLWGYDKNAGFLVIVADRLQPPE
jgi:ubiquinone/menaquinone biosynthesis C-methylase UbiE